MALTEARFGKMGFEEHAGERGPSGETLVLLHDWLQDRSQMARLLPALHGRRVLNLDLPGCGESECPKGSYNVYYLTRSVVAAIDQLDGWPVRVLGVGLGGAVACQVAHEQRERVKGLVLVAPPGWTRPMSRREQLIASPLAGPLFALTGPQIAERYWRARYYSESELDPSRLSVMRQGLTRRGAGLAAARMYGPHRDPLLRILLSVLATPTTLLWGHEDRVRGLDEAERFAAQKPSCILEVVEGAGHALVETHPERVAAALLRAGDPAVGATPS